MEEEYKTIKGYSKYEVSNFGNVRNFKTHRILTPKRNSTGYMLVNLYKDYKSKSFTIQKLVCEAFLEKPLMIELNSSSFFLLFRTSLGYIKHFVKIFHYCD